MKTKKSKIYLNMRNPVLLGAIVLAVIFYYFDLLLVT